MQKQEIDADFEIEMKFRARDLACLEKAGDTFLSMTTDITRKRDFVTTLHYHDTQNRDLLMSGVVLRALDATPPHFGPHIEIKSNPVAGSTQNDGAIMRTEYCIPISKNGLLLDEIKDHPGAAMLTAAKGQDLYHWFTTVNHRKDYRGVFDIDGKKAVVDCCIDSVEFFNPAGTRIHKAFEVEIEFKQEYSDTSLTAKQAEDLLRKIAAILCDNVKDLTPQSATRADTGFSLSPLLPSVPAIQPKGLKK